jgi:hypothetical protein
VEELVILDVGLFDLSLSHVYFTQSAAWMKRVFMNEWEAQSHNSMTLVLSLQTQMVAPS